MKSYKEIFKLHTKDEILKSGVYKIFFHGNDDDFYIGHTFSGFCNRIRMHVSLLNRGIHNSFKMQSAFNVYGIDKMRIQILKVCDTKEECIQNERILIMDKNPSFNTNRGNAIFSKVNTIKIKKKSATPYVHKKGKQLDWGVLIKNMEVEDEILTSSVCIVNIRSSARRICKEDKTKKFYVSKKTKIKGKIIIRRVK